MNNQKHQLGFLSIVLLGINGIIGSGIFLLPNIGVKIFGPASILVLILDAILALTIGLCYAECSSLFKEDGGSYLYARSAFGNFIGYEVGIAEWVVQIIGCASQFVAFVTALSGIFPNLAQPLMKNSIITMFALILMTMNLLGVNISKILNNVVTISKLVPIILIIIVGIFFIHPINFSPFFVPKLMTAGNLSAISLTFFYIFAGFEKIVISAGDMKNATKNIPKAIITILSIITIIYILIMVVCIGTLGNKLPNTNVPLQTAFTKMVGPWGGNLMILGSLLSIGGICITLMIIAPHASVALANHNILPKSFAKFNRFNSPYISTITFTVLSLLISYSGTFSTLAQITAVARFAQFIPTCIAVIVFRKRYAKNKRGFKAPFGLTIPIIALVISFWLLISTTKINLIWGLGALIIAMPFYLLTNQHRNNSKNI